MFSENVESLLDDIQFSHTPCSPTADDILAAFPQGTHIHLLQCMSQNTYIEVFREIYNKFIETGEQSLLYLLFEIFYPYESFETYDILYDAVSKIPEKNSTLSYIKNLYLLYNPNNTSFASQPNHEKPSAFRIFNKLSPNNDDVSQEINYTFNDVLHKNRPVYNHYFESYDKQLNYISRLAFTLVRYIHYRAPEHTSFIPLLCDRLYEVKNTVLQAIVKGNMLKSLATRAYTLIAAYHNIYIKYMIDSTGRAHIKPYIDAYRDDYITLDTHLRQYCLIQTYTKMTNMIREIVGYYNFIGEDYSPMYIHYNEVVNNAIQKIEEMKIRDIYNDPVRDHTRVEIGALFLGYAMFFTDSENHQFTLLKNKSLEFLHSIYSKHTPHKDNRNAFFPEQVWF